MYACSWHGMRSAISDRRYSWKVERSINSKKFTRTHVRLYEDLNKCLWRTQNIILVSRIKLYHPDLADKNVLPREYKENDKGQQRIKFHLYFFFHFLLFDCVRFLSFAKGQQMIEKISKLKYAYHIVPRARKVVS